MRAAVMFGLALGAVACGTGGGSDGDDELDAAVDAMVEAMVEDMRVEPDEAVVDMAPRAMCGAQIVYTFDEPVSFRRLPAQEATRGEFDASCAAERGPERIVEVVLAEPSRVELYTESEIALTVFVRSSCLDAQTEVICERIEGEPVFELGAGRWYFFFEPAEAVDLPSIYVRTVSEPL